MFRFELDADLHDEPVASEIRRITAAYGHVEVIVYAENPKQAAAEFLKLWYVDEEDEEEGGWLD